MQLNGTRTLTWARPLSMTAAGLLLLQYVLGFGLLADHDITAAHYLFALAAIIPVGYEHMVASTQEAPTTRARLGLFASAATTCSSWWLTRSQSRGSRWRKTSTSASSAAASPVRQLPLTFAREGYSVALIEREAAFRDKARGEGIHPWGMDEAEDLGLLDVIRTGGAHPCPSG